MKEYGNHKYIFNVLKFIFSEKDTKIWRNLPFKVLTLLFKWCQKHEENYAKLLRPSQKSWTLPYNEKKSLFHRFVTTVLGAGFNSEKELDLANIVDNEVNANTPILMCSVAGFDASGEFLIKKVVDFYRGD